MRPRSVGRLGPTDVVTAGNAALGFVTAVLTAVDMHLMVKVVLLAAMADGPNDAVARRYGGTDTGPYFDSLADVVSFGVAPALLIVVVVREMQGFDRVRVVTGVDVATLFVAIAVVGLALYTAYGNGSDKTTGVPTMLAAAVLPAGIPVGFVGPMSFVGLSTAMTMLMPLDVTYPDLRAQDALVMDVVQSLAIACSGTLGEGFSSDLLSLALGYLSLGSRFYWV